MNLVEDLKYFFTKEGRLGDDWQPFIVNRYLSFHPKTFRLAADTAKDLFYVDKEIMKAFYYINVPMSKGSFWYIFKKYIKKTKEKEQKYKIVIDRMAKKYHWTSTETNRNIPLLINILENDKDLLLQTLKQECVDMRTFKRFGFSVKDIKPKVTKIKQSASLGNWIK